MHECPQSLFIFYNSFSLRLTENLHEQKAFSKSIYYMFCLYHFSVKCIIKKNYLPPYGPVKGRVQDKKSLLLFIVWQLCIEQLLSRIATLNLFVLEFIFVKLILIGLP